jgi:hypothetical protein
MSPAATATGTNAFREAFTRFQRLVAAKSGHPFTNFHEGLAAVWEDYKPRLRGPCAWPASTQGMVGK